MRDETTVGMAVRMEGNSFTTVLLAAMTSGGIASERRCL
jgi:hypothetical protein